MLPGIKNDLMYLLNILECIEKIILYSADCADAEEVVDCGIYVPYSCQRAAGRTYNSG